MGRQRRGQEPSPDDSSSMRNSALGQGRNCMADAGDFADRRQDHNGVRRSGMVGLREGCRRRRGLAPEELDIRALFRKKPVLNASEASGRGCRRANLSELGQRRARLSCGRGDPKQADPKAKSSTMLSLMTRTPSESLADAIGRARCTGRSAEPRKQRTTSEGSSIVSGAKKRGGRAPIRHEGGSTS